jgi:cyclic-di-GMP-binding protein
MTPGVGIAEKRELPAKNCGFETVSSGNLRGYIFIDFRKRYDMPENTFDIVSKIDLEEVSNAIQQASKEVHTRFDLKDSKSKIELEKDAIVLHSMDEYKLKSVSDILQQKLAKRGVPLKGLTHGVIESALGGTAKQKITLQQGIPMEKAKEIVQLIKGSKNKVQASIQGDLIRVSGKDRDTLQAVIALLKQKDFGIDMQFTNYRTN